MERQPTHKRHGTTHIHILSHIIPVRPVLDQRPAIHHAHQSPCYKDTITNGNTPSCALVRACQHPSGGLPLPGPQMCSMACPEGQQPINCWHSPTWWHSRPSLLEPWQAPAPTRHYFATHFSCQTAERVNQNSQQKLRTPPPPPPPPPHIAKHEESSQQLSLAAQHQVHACGVWA